MRLARVERAPAARGVSEEERGVHVEQQHGNFYASDDKVDCREVRA